MFQFFVMGFPYVLAPRSKDDKKDTDVGETVYSQMALEMHQQDHQFASCFKLDLAMLR